MTLTEHLDSNSNYFAINNLPIEIISHILWLGVPAHGIDVPFHYKYDIQKHVSDIRRARGYLSIIQLVCQFWRTITVSNPHMWTMACWESSGWRAYGGWDVEIATESLTPFHNFLSRSKELDIDLTIEEPLEFSSKLEISQILHCDSVLASLLHSIYGNFGRVRSLHLHNPSRVIWPLAVSWPHLIRLKLSLKDPKYWIATSPPVCDLPALRELDITNIYGRNSEIAVASLLRNLGPPTLRTLCISTDLTNIAPIIRKFSHLEQLTLNKCWGDVGNESFPACEAIVISKLDLGPFVYNIVSAVAKSLTKLHLNVAVHNRERLNLLPSLPAF